MIPPTIAVNARGRVLVVDDNRDAADTLAEILKLSGHEGFVGHSGQEALDLGARERPDAIILDIGMPDITGYEAARRVRLEPWGRDVFLLAMTGWGQADDKAKARAAGFNAHLTKPVDLDEVESMLAEVLKSRSA
jgi:CheY-like chemotaxis protein